MKKVRLALPVVAVAAMVAFVGYQTQVAFAQDHSQHGMAPAAGVAHDHGATAKTPAKPQAAVQPQQKAKGNEAAIAEQKGSYPLNTCVVMGEKLGEHGPAYDYVYKGRLVRFCCKGCEATFSKDPNSYLSKIDAAAKEKAKAKAETKKQSAGTATNATGHAHHH